MSDGLYVKKPSEAEIAETNAAVETYIERIFESPEEYRQTLNSAKFSDFIVENPVSNPDTT